MRQTLGRPPIYTANSKVYLCATGQTKLQSGSDRRAIINAAQVAAIVSTKRYESANQSIGAVIRLEGV